MNSLTEEATERLRLDHGAQCRALVSSLEDKKVSKLPAASISNENVTAGIE